jgi:hypothetical protein
MTGIFLGSILADSVIYAWVMVLLLWTSRSSRLPVGE